MSPINDVRSTNIGSEIAILNKSRIAIGNLFEMYRTTHIQEEGKLMYKLRDWLLGWVEFVSLSEDICNDGWYGSLVTIEALSAET